MTNAIWTLDELVARVARALDGPAYAGAPNGRVRDVPDARAIRWYSTIGLVDRPSAMRGRTALYGRRHLLQLVAVKRRQAEGLRIADIQAELAGATDRLLESIAGVAVSTVESTLESTVEPSSASRPEPRDGAFWKTTARRSPAPSQSALPASEGFALTGVPLGGGAVLLVPAPVAASDIAAIEAAARPLLAELAARGLLADAGSSQEIEADPGPPPNRRGSATR